MNALSPRLLLLALPCCLLISCATSTRYVEVTVPEGSRLGGGGRFEITQVTDARRFETNPDEPSTPSIGGQTKKGTPQERIVGRQRGSFGQAFGNVLLVQGQTVPERVQALLTEGLARRGHSLAAGGIPLQVEVQQFWAWMNPGMWTITLEAKIECVVHLRGGRQLRVRGHGENYCQAATDTNWRQAYEFTVEDFLKNLSTELDAAGY
ncbi:hypothetical protein SAMN02745166_02267 [Prosthecobacter debontii]|uniref:Lipoprotein n=1 Tax=Prosthecobacter debontii TaxID=48467 RepID=A0A1T4Y1D2_9BACT|nr:hypothetical protein [Prosthecobacter debontii]SKA95085.1 hypothetical protein SAMN02745166_02267 [Prosthecobacter debontii]